MKLQWDREQTAHLQAALLHPGGCGPRYEPLSRAPFNRRVWAQLPRAGLVEFTDCRSDLSMQLREHVYRGGSVENELWVDWQGLAVMPDWAPLPAAQPWRARAAVPCMAA